MRITALRGRPEMINGGGTRIVCTIGPKACPGRFLLMRCFKFTNDSDSPSASVANWKLASTKLQFLSRRSALTKYPRTRPDNWSLENGPVNWGHSKISLINPWMRYAVQLMARSSTSCLAAGKPLRNGLSRSEEHTSELQ